MAQTKLLWVKSRFTKQQLIDQPVNLVVRGKTITGRFDVLGPNKKGELQITFVYERLTGEELKTTRLKLTQKFVDNLKIE